MKRYEIPEEVVAHSGEEGEQACVVCPDGEYRASKCSNGEAVCAECSTCAIGEFRSSGCNGVDNSVCSACTTCAIGEYQSTNCQYKTIQLLNTPISIQSDNLITNIYLENNFEVSFQIMPIATGSNWRNILRITNTNTDGGRGGRMVGVWFHSNTTRFYIVVGHESNWNEVINTENNIP